MYGDPNHSLSSQGPGFKYLWDCSEINVFLKIEKNNFTEIRRSDLITSFCVYRFLWFVQQVIQEADQPQYVP